VENSPVVRTHIGEGLEMKVYEKQNKNNASIISADDSQITVRMIPANEESMIA
jgi:acetate kinase